MNSRSISLSAALAIVLCIGCEHFALDIRSNLGFRNNAAYDVVCFIPDDHFGEPMYPDTSLPADSPKYLHTVPAGQGGHLTDWSGTWKNIFKSMPRGTFSVYVFNADTLKKYNWAEIREGYKIARRYDVTYEYVKKNEATIHYP